MTDRDVILTVNDVSYRVVVDEEEDTEWLCYPAVILRDDGDGYRIVHDLDGELTPQATISTAREWAEEQESHRATAS